MTPSENARWDDDPPAGRRQDIDKTANSFFKVKKDGRAPVFFTNQL
jgi:hypothetical protein